MKPDRIDARILSELQKDGRKTVVDIANDVGLSGTPCGRRIRQLEDEGVIQGYTAVINPSKLGLNVRAFVQVRLVRHTDDNIQQFRQELEQLDEVVSCDAITGDYDFLLQIITTELDTLSNVVLKKLLRIPSVRDIHSSIVLESVKRFVRLPVAHLT